ncbi:MAG: hypothetical protein LC731_01105 [Acidobacteria bacterium]|nr:hypothetical protein [Acidobacteriota bacterium]
MGAFSARQNQLQKETSTSSAAARSAAYQVEARTHPILKLQSIIGNQAVLRTLQRQVQSPAHDASPAVVEVKDTRLPDDEIKKEYFSIVAQGEEHYAEAIQYLIDTYGFDDSSTVISYDKTIGTSVYAVTGGIPGGMTFVIRFGPLLFDKNTDFGTIVRAVAHELLHARQMGVDWVTDHSEREFLAYYDTLMRKDLPKIGSEEDITGFITKAYGYYWKLSEERQALYADLIEDIRREYAENIFLTVYESVMSPANQEDTDLAKLKNLVSLAQDLYEELPADLQAKYAGKKRAMQSLYFAREDAAKKAAGQKTQ